MEVILLLLTDLRAIGNRLFLIRKKRGMTQAEVAEAAGVSDHTYAEIERGITNMRIITFTQICSALKITPDEILTEANEQTAAREADIMARLNACPPRDKETALRLLDVYLQSLSQKQ